MRASKVLPAQLNRAINTHGVLYTFHREKLNAFNEPDGEAFAKSIPGIFHMTTNHKSESHGDAATVPTKNTPSILARFDDAAGITRGDVVYIDGVKYHVTGLTDVSRWGIALDISLEMELTVERKGGVVQNAIG